MFFMIALRFLRIYKVRNLKNLELVVICKRGHSAESILLEAVQREIQAETRAKGPVLQCAKDQALVSLQ
jgi:hypothetical protein